MGDLRRENVWFSLKCWILKEKTRDFRLNVGFSKRKRDFQVKWGISEEKTRDFQVKWGISEEKTCDFRLNGGIWEEKIRDLHLNGGFSKRKRLIFT